MPGCHTLHPQATVLWTQEKAGRLPYTHNPSEERWQVERRHGWIDNFRRLGVRYDRHADSYLAFFTIACLMMAH